MIIAESIGFAATHSISEILGQIPEVEVSHGSQHFAEKCPIGQGSQSVDQFVASMTEAQSAGRTPVAVHTLFHPQQMKPAIEAAMEVLGAALTEGRDVNLPGLGKMKIKRSKTTEGRRVIEMRLRQNM